MTDRTAPAKEAAAEALEPCPCCSRTMLLHENDWADPPMWSAYCSNIHCGLHTPEKATREEAITHANRRSSPVREGDGGLPDLSRGSDAPSVLLALDKLQSIAPDPYRPVLLSSERAFLDLALAEYPGVREVVRVAIADLEMARHHGPILAAAYSAAAAQGAEAMRKACIKLIMETDGNRIQHGPFHFGPTVIPRRAVGDAISSLPLPPSLSPSEPSGRGERDAVIEPRHLRNRAQTIRSALGAGWEDTAQLLERAADALEK